MHVTLDLIAVLVYGKGVNAQQTILKFLADLSKETFTVETIARQTNLGYHTARKALTDLKNAEYVQVTKGNWSITALGQFEQERNPNFSLKFQLTKTTNGRENWAELLGPEVINSGFGRQLLQKPPRELLSRIEKYLPYFVLAWLVTEGIEVDFNTFDEMLPENATTDRVVEAFNLLLQDLES